MKRFLPYLALLVPCLLYAGIILSAGSVMLMKKAVAFLILPAGLVWVLLGFVVFWPGLRRIQRGFFLLLWLLYTAAGNPIVGNVLLRSLEQPYAGIAEPKEPLDFLFVLGGGTSTDLEGDAQIGTAGDRIVTAARLYHQGRVDTLVASGRSVTDIGGERSLAEDAVAIWKDLGVPESAMVTLSKPTDTRSEIDAYVEFLAQFPERKRIGLCTSAWHMERTGRILEEKGLEYTPVPADFRSRPIPVISLYLVPRMRGFAHVQMGLWEYLGIWFD